MVIMRPPTGILYVNTHILYLFSYYTCISRIYIFLQMHERRLSFNNNAQKLPCMPIC